MSIYIVIIISLIDVDLNIMIILEPNPIIRK